MGLEVFHHLYKRLSFWGVSQPQLPLFIHFQSNSSLFNLDRIFKASTKIGGGGDINFYVSPSLCVCVCVCVCKKGGREGNRKKNPCETGRFVKNCESYKNLHTPPLPKQQQTHTQPPLADK